MKFFRDLRKMCYVIEIDPKEMTAMCVKCNRLDPDHFEFLLAREIADALVPLIKKDQAEYGAR